MTLQCRQCGLHLSESYTLLNIEIRQGCITTALQPAMTLQCRQCGLHLLKVTTLLNTSAYPCTVPVRRYRSLPRSPSCTFRTPVHCPFPTPAHRAPLSLYRSLPRSAPCPFRTPCTVPVGRYRSLPRPPCTFPWSRAPSVHRYRSLPRSPPCPFPGPVHRPRPCTVISDPSLPAASRAPVHRPRAPLSLSAPCPFRTPVHLPRAAPSPCTVIALCPGPLPYTRAPSHRYRSLPRSPPCPFHGPCTVPLHGEERDNGARLHGKVQGPAESDKRCTGTVHGDGARAPREGAGRPGCTEGAGAEVHGQAGCTGLVKGQGEDRGRER